MLFGEMVPKNIAIAEPARTALVLGPPLVTLTHALRPFVLGVNALANGGLRLLRVEPRNAVASAFSDAELARMVTDSGRAGVLDAQATSRVREALELGRRPVGEVATPVERVVRARLGITPDGLERLSAESGFSRFPVTGHDGLTMGYLHVKDALAAGARQQAFPAAALRPITRVNARTALDDVLTAMRARRTHLAEVVDASGHPTGLVTMEDVLRELVGRPGPTPEGAVAGS
jgi:CBS domain containing-hemolysin-like protein